MINNKFIVIVPVYAADKYIEKCMNSILNQEYNNFDIIVVDDCSTDNTSKILLKLHDEYEFELVRNDKRVGSPLANFIKGIGLISKDKEDIIVTVDGDDWFYDNNVLSYLNEIYQDDNIWMTYGQYEPLSKTYSNYCKPIPDTRTYRKSGQWLASHLRTVKRKLFVRIDKNDLKEKTGEYYLCAGDAAYMYPIIEMAGKNHIKFIEKILYIYNDMSPDNEMKKNMTKQLETAKEIREKSIYDEIDKI